MTTLSVDIPVIETERLILREPREADLPAVAGFYASERSVFVGGGSAVVGRDGPRGADWAAWRGTSSALGHWLLRGYGSWTIELRATGQVAGRAGFLNPTVWSEPELGWQVYEGFEGQGIAYEAALAARAAGPRLFGLNGVISHIDPANARSIRLAERLGATFERNAELLGKPCQIWRHPEVQA
ncbi:GNAT family N-acetyltransferase [Paracoccus contaminans]|uniref:GNAT family N-acetyltransferase n=2 Tax=Paracoccus contaminans TaxID=1945662 RepID=A0A1W6D0W4_9RHOB|nr:GNAT family N-acetyltransferase [Paracoccus contaminans]ARJ70773.1 GNAT family N-acetyltransferase [Paracoccus contaminans]